MRFEDLSDFVNYYFGISSSLSAIGRTSLVGGEGKGEVALSHRSRHVRKETWHAEKYPDGRWRKFNYTDILARDKTSFDIFWLKDKSLADLDNLPDPKDLAEDIVENIEAGLNNFRNVLAALGKQ
jgi:hypothetical protein